MALLLEKQQRYDQQKFNQNSWEVTGNWRIQKTRHIGHHIAIATFTLLEGDRRRIEQQVVPDLSIYRAQLINTHGLQQRTYGEVAHKASNDNSVMRELARTSGQIAVYAEAAEHGRMDERTREVRIADAVAHLHVATESLAHIHGVDVEAAHQARLEQLMGEDAHLLG
jgi:hypothetical protein